MKNTAIYLTLFLGALTSCTDDDDYITEATPREKKPVIAEVVINAPIKNDPIIAENVKAEGEEDISPSEESIQEKKNTTGVDYETQSYFAENYPNYYSADSWDSDDEEE